MNVTLDAIWNGYAQLKKKDVILRVVTEVTPDNIPYVKKLMGLFEVRHLKGVKSNFGMVDKRECLLYSISHEDQPLSHAIITNAKALVEALSVTIATVFIISVTDLLPLLPAVTSVYFTEPVQLINEVVYG